MSLYRQFLKFSILIIGVVIVGAVSTSGNDGSKSGHPESRPNILIAVADDWSWPHASIYIESDDVIQTPNFDKTARNGVLFTNAYTAVPSCTPSRAALLTGQYPHRLEEGASLWGTLPSKFPVYTYMLKKAGYVVGFERKGWAPGKYKVGGRSHNPAGYRYDSFEAFFDKLPNNNPFCFWFGSRDPHRPYQKDSGLQSGMDPSRVEVPAYLPDDPVVRKDILDYYYEVERFDREVGEILDLLEQSGQMENTIIVITSDNGWPFPRSKANLYDTGTRMPLAIAWGNNISKGQVIDEFVSLIDLAPTFLEAAGVKVPTQMSGRSLLPFLEGKSTCQERDKVFLERERHAYVRKGNEGYPARAVRTEDFLYIRNFEPNRWPAGDPEPVALGPFGDVDGSPTKDFILSKRYQMPIYPEENRIEKYTYFKMAFAKRPAEELYDLRNDPHQLHNVAGQLGYNGKLVHFRKILKEWMEKSDDPRAMGSAKFDQYPYYGRQPADREKR